MSSTELRVLFVCLGNICRSPTAEAVLRKRIETSALPVSVHVDSAGTGDWHVGRAPDARMQKAAFNRGYDLSALRARQVTMSDAENFDFVVAMDENNLRDLEDVMPGRAVKCMSFVPGREREDIPDPYYGGASGFDLVIDMIEDACDGLIGVLRERTAQTRNAPSGTNGA